MILHLSFLGIHESVVGRAQQGEFGVGDDMYRKILHHIGETPLMLESAYKAFGIKEWQDTGRDATT